jgi:hypothetical protein
MCVGDVVKKSELDVVVHACSPRTEEAGRSQV